MQSLICEALTAGKLQEVVDLACQYLRSVEDHSADWNFGNAIHTPHIALGKVALHHNDVKAAKEHLLKAAATPNMALARDLLVLGEKKVVLEYLKLCGKFWIKEFSHLYLDGREKDIREGIVPNFRGHFLSF